MDHIGTLSSKVELMRAKQDFTVTYGKYESITTGNSALERIQIWKPMRKITNHYQFVVIDLQGQELLISAGI